MWLGRLCRGCTGQLLAGSFGQVLLAQALAAVGAAAAVVTQTVLRDHLQGPALAQAFSWIGMALALSPAIGLALGTLLVAVHGYVGVQSGLLRPLSCWQSHAWLACAKAALHISRTRPCCRCCGNRCAIAGSGHTHCW